LYGCSGAVRSGVGSGGCRQWIYGYGSGSSCGAVIRIGHSYGIGSGISCSCRRNCRVLCSIGVCVWSGPGISCSACRVQLYGCSGAVRPGVGSCRRWQRIYGYRCGGGSRTAANRCYGHSIGPGICYSSRRNRRILRCVRISARAAPAIGRSSAGIQLNGLSCAIRPCVRSYRRRHWVYGHRCGGRGCTAGRCCYGHGVGSRHGRCRCRNGRVLRSIGISARTAPGICSAACGIQLNGLPCTIRSCIRSCRRWQRIYGYGGGCRCGTSSHTGRGYGICSRHGCS